MSTEPEDFNTGVIREFRSNQGRVGGPFQGAPLLLLHTRGARTGQERVHPVMYLDLDGRRFVFASKGGADTDPDWYLNLRAHPEVEIELGTTSYQARAQPLAGPERDRVYAEQVRHVPTFGDYQQQTSRAIPVVELLPLS